MKIYQTYKTVVLVIGLLPSIIMGNLGAATNYIRAGAVGSQNGGNWTDAFTNFPSVLDRGGTYLVAGGTYPSKTFNDAVSGTNLIAIRHASTNDHGTSTGWSDAYGTNAVLYPLTFSQGYYLIDGLSGGGPGEWTNGFGFRIKGILAGYDYLTQFRVGGSNVSFRHVAIGNDEWPTPGCDNAGYSAAGADNINFAYCYIFNLGDVGFTLLDAQNWTWEFCRMDKIDRTGIQTVCGTIGNANHGAGIELSGTICRDITIRNCFITNVEGTGWIGIYTTTGVSNLLVYGNIFANTPEFTGTWGNGVVYNVSGAIGPLKNVKIFNNTFANLNTPAIVGLTADIGGSRENSASSGNSFFNNILWNIQGIPAIDGADSRVSNAGEHLLTGDSTFQLLRLNPFLGDAFNDFRLRNPTFSGTNLPVSDLTDMLGQIRGSGGSLDRGAIDYIEEGDLRPDSPSRLRAE